MEQKEELEEEKKARGLLEAKLGLAEAEVEDSRGLRKEMKHALGQAQDKYQQVQEKVESLSHHLSKAEATAVLLQQQMENRNAEKQAQTDGMLLKKFLEEKIKMLEAQNKEMASRNVELQNLLELEKNEKENILSQAHQKLTDTEKNLSFCHESAEMINHQRIKLQEENFCMQNEKNRLEGCLRELEYQYEQSMLCIRRQRSALNKKDITNQRLEECLQQLRNENARLAEAAMLQESPEDEKLGMQKYITKLEGMLRETENKYKQSKKALDGKEREIVAYSQKLQEYVTISTDKSRTIAQLEASVQQMKTENARLEEVTEQQSSVIASLQKEAEEAAKLKKGTKEQQKQRVQSVDGRTQLEETEVELQEESENVKELQEALQEQRELLQNERMTLSQQLQEAQENAEMKEQAMKDLQECLNSTLAKMQAINEEKVEMTEERSRIREELAYKDAELQELLSALCEAQQTQADTESELMTCKALLEEKTLQCGDVQEAKVCMQRDIDWLEKRLLQQAGEMGQLTRCLHNLRQSLELKEREVLTSASKLQEALSTTALLERTVRRLEDSAERSEMENSRLEDLIKQQNSQISILQKEADKVETVKKALEEHFNEELQKQTVLLLNAETQMKEVEAALLEEKEKVNRARAVQGTLHRQLEQEQNERVMLCQELQDVQKISELKEQALRDMQDCINDTLAQVRAEKEERVHMVERRNKELGSKNAELQELLDHKEIDKEDTLRLVWQELSATQEKLSVCEASLEDSTRQCRNLEEDKLRVQMEMNRLKVLLQQSEDKYLQSVHGNDKPKSAMGKTKQEEDCSEYVQQLETENTRLQEAAEQQGSIIALLQKDAEEAAIMKKDVEEQLTQEVQKQNMLFLNAQAQLKEMEAALLCEREKVSDANAQQKALQDQMEQMQNECTALCQHLEDSQKTAEMKGKALMDMQDCLGETLAKMEEHNEKKVQMVEERNKELARENAELQNRLACKDTEGESPLWQVQQELIENQKQLSICRASLLDNAWQCEQLEREGAEMQKYITRLEGMLQESEERHVLSTRCNHKLQSDLDDKDSEIVAYARTLQECLTSFTDMNKTISQLQESVQQMKMENARLEEALKHQNNNISVVEKEAEEALQDQMEKMQNECKMLCQQFQDAQKYDGMKERAMRDMQHYLNDALAKIEGYEETTKMLEERNIELASRNAELQDQLDYRKTDRESGHRKIQQELSDSQTKLSACEASLKDSQRQCQELEEEKICIQMEKNGLEKMLQESKEKCTRLEHHAQNLTCTLNDKEREITASTQRLQEVVSANASMERTVNQLQEAVQQMVTQKSRLEAAFADQKNRITQLQDMVEKATKKDFEEQSSKVMQKRRLQTLSAHIQQRERELQDMDEQATQSNLQDALQLHLDQMKEEATALRQQLEEARKTGQDKEQELADMKAYITDLIAKMQADSEEKVQMVEAKRMELATRNAELQKLLESKVSEREVSDILEQELAHPQRKLRLCEQSLELKTQHCGTLKEEKLDMQVKINTLERQLQDSEDRYSQSEQRIQSLKNALDNKARDVTAFSQNLEKVLSASKGMENTIMQLEKTVHSLEIENAKLETRAKWQTERTSVLQQEIDKTAEAKMHLEEKLVQEMQLKSQACREMVSMQLQKEDAISKMTARVNELSQQLEREVLRCSSLDEDNRRLAAQISSLKALSEGYKWMKDRASRAEEEVAFLRQQFEIMQRSREENQPSNNYTPSSGPFPSTSTTGGHQGQRG